MFWGLIMEPGRCYTQKVKVSFHVSMAALDISNSSEDPVQVMCVFEGRNYLLCTLHKKEKLQCPLDLNFEAGSKVSFATNGKAHVHLTGYLTHLEDDLFEEEAQEEEVEVVKKEKKRPVKEITDGPPSKRTKSAKNNLINLEAEEEEDSSDSDFDLDHLINEEGTGHDSEEEEDEDDEDAEEEEDEDASSLSGEEEEEEEESEEEKEVKPKQNGVAKTKSPSQQKKNKEQKPQEKVPKQKPKKQEENKQQKQKKTVLKGGIIAQDIKEGAGNPAKGGNLVHVYYEGRLKENNKLFDSTTKGAGFSFRLGRGEVIKGWDIGLIGMKAGGKRRIICPPTTAYGVDGSPPVIPPNATLVFDVELKKIS